MRVSPSGEVTPTVRTLTVDDIDDFAAGALLLGSGGGGDVDLGAILLRNLMGTVEVRRADELPPSARVVHVGMSGSPDVLAERLISVDDSVRAVRAVEAHLDEPAAAIGTAEIGGLNALIAVAVAHEMGLPLVDADIMGRAYPRLTQTSLTAAGYSPEPVAIVSPSGGTVVLSNCSHAALEALVDACSATMGGLVATADYPVTAGELAVHGVDGSVSACLELGRRFNEFRTNDLAELCSALGFFVLHEGRIDQIHPRVRRTPGSITIDATTASDPVRVDFAEEFIGITVGGTSVASVPDVILALDHLTRLPLHPEQLRVGQTAIFVSMRSLHAWSPEDLALVGPLSYGMIIEEEEA